MPRLRLGPWDLEDSANQGHTTTCQTSFLPESTCAFSPRQLEHGSHSLGVSQEGLQKKVSADLHSEDAALCWG